MPRTQRHHENRVAAPPAGDVVTPECHATIDHVILAERLGNGDYIAPWGAGCFDFDDGPPTGLDPDTYWTQDDEP